MKTLEELRELREKEKVNVSLRHNGKQATRVAVGMATCGITAGARDVLAAFVEAVAAAQVPDTMVIATDCIGLCKLEPVVEVFVHGKEKVTYVEMTPEKARRVVQEHLVGGNVVTEYTLS